MISLKAGVDSEKYVPQFPDTFKEKLGGGKYVHSDLLPLWVRKPSLIISENQHRSKIIP